MSWTLGIDTSTAELGVGLACHGQPVAACSRYVPNSHAEHLDSTIAFLLKSNALAPTAIERIGVAAGPGSFTGLRIGHAYVKGMFLGRPVPVLALSSLEVVARALTETEDRDYAIAFDARRGDVYYAHFRREAGTLVRRCEDTLAPVAQLALEAGSGETVVCDTLGYARSTIEELFNAHQVRTVAVEHLHVQRGLACALAAATLPAQDTRWCTPCDLLPVYLRASAPEERLHSPEKRG